MEEAYKQLSGAPAGDAVSNAAKGEKPLTDDEERIQHFEETQGAESDAVDEPETSATPDDLEEAYAQLFESLATIMRKGN